MAIKSTQKFTKEELNQLEDLQTEINRLTARFGSLQIAKIKLEKEDLLLKSQLDISTTKEIEIAKKLTEKYGKGSLDIKTGEFTPIK